MRAYSGKLPSFILKIQRAVTTTTTTTKEQPTAAPWQCVSMHMCTNNLYTFNMGVYYTLIGDDGGGGGPAEALTEYKRTT